MHHPTSPYQDRLDATIEIILTVALCLTAYVLCWLLFI